MRVPPQLPKPGELVILHTHPSETGKAGGGVCRLIWPTLRNTPPALEVYADSIVVGILLQLLPLARAIALVHTDSSLKQGALGTGGVAYTERAEEAE